MSAADTQSVAIPPRIAQGETVYLGLGSNIGNRAHAMQEALDRIALLPDTDVLRTSSVYESEPWGDSAQGQFFNAVAEIRTALEPAALLRALKDIERDIGRVPTRRYGPRLIDIDILLYGERVVHDERLEIPHPGLTERQFVLLPLQELAGTEMHPVLHASIAALTESAPDSGRIWPTNARLEPSATAARSARRASRRRKGALRRDRRSIRRR